MTTSRWWRHLGQNRRATPRGACREFEAWDEDASDGQQPVGDGVTEEEILDHEGLTVAEEANEDVKQAPKVVKKVVEHEDRIPDRKSGS